MSRTHFIAVAQRSSIRVAANTAAAFGIPLAVVQLWLRTM